MDPINLKNVWLCDDDVDDHYLFTEGLNQVVPQASLTIFSNGNELLNALKQQPPDILFLDINMPNINGLETLQEIKAQPRLKDLRVVMYSVSEQKSDALAAYQFGAVLYMVKPLLYQDVLDQLTSIFEQDWTNVNYIAAPPRNETTAIVSSGEIKL